MTTQTRAPQSNVPLLPGSEYVSSLAEKSFKPGSNISFGLANSRVTVTLDHLGDWTIMIGLSARSDRIVSTMFSLERLGFFKATEAEGSIYLLWTSALIYQRNSRNVVEEVLFETLKALQRGQITQYIC